MSADDPRIVIVGAGGWVFPMELVRDFLSFPALGSATIVLYDIDVPSAERTATSAEELISLGGLSARIEVPTTLRDALPTGGRGTLEDRLTDVRIRAKTGTLDDVSALSGWVWLEKTGGWVEFSILSSGFNEWTAKKIEDRIVRIVSFHASAPP